MTSFVADFSVVEEIGLARAHELVRLTFPVATAVARELSAFAAATADGAPLPVQPLAASRDSDGWIREAVIAVPVSVGARGATAISVTALDSATAPDHGAAVSTTALTEKVVLHHPQFSVSTGDSLLVIEGSEVGRRTVSSSIGMPDGSSAWALVDPSTVVVHHEGPLLAELTISGDFVDESQRPTGWRFRAKISAAASQSTATVQLQLINASGSSDDAELTHWALQVQGEPVSELTCGAFDAVYRGQVPATIRANGVGHARGVFAVAQLEGGTAWQFAGADDYWSSWEWSELQGITPTNWVSAHSEHPITVAVQRFTENHPGEIRVDHEGVTVAFWPESAAPLIMTEGSAKTMTVSVTAGIDSTAGERLDMPLVPHPGLAARRFDVYEVLALDAAARPMLESHIREELFSWYQSGQSLGFHDYGDGVQGITTGPRTGYSANNEHDALLALVLQYLRSGERAYFESAKAYADHLIDIDRIHSSSQFAAEVGGLRAHGRAHVHRVAAHTVNGQVLTSIDTGHMWTEGLVLLGQLTGDERYLEAARGVGECILRLHELGWTRPQPGPRNAGWPLLALSALARLDHEPRVIAAIRDISELALSAQSADGRWLMRLGHLRDYCAWQNAVLISGLLRGAEVTGDAVARDGAIAGARALITTGRNPDGTFVFLGRFDYRWANRSALIREALALAWDHDADDDYLRAGLDGGDRWYRPRGSGPALSNDIAEWRGHLPFLERARRAGLLGDMAGGAS
ncbi:hypothetical protein [Microcella sp.]|uniref:hypothetical protein n=1 Tax=Microcella sp. TaxID=1913979 RepID=UPI0025695680|nr:hypothetical protein [Microcella sp.]MBX9471925.1 hypothetical protein [Microcella sp.]